MENATHDTTLKAKVLAAIESGRVTMRPKWHFALTTALMAAGLVFLSLALVYLLSFIIFAMRECGAWYVTPFGLRGLGTFLTAVPWVLFLVALAILAIVETLVRRFSFAYRRPLLYSVLGILAIVTIASLGVARMPFHTTLMRGAERDELPFGGGFYRDYGGYDADDVYPGFVARFIDEGFELETRGAGVLPVLVSPSTKFVPDGRIAVGDRVVVFGPLAEGRIHAFGVRQLLPTQYFIQR